MEDERSAPFQGTDDLEVDGSPEEATESFKDPKKLIILYGQRNLSMKAAFGCRNGIQCTRHPGRRAILPLIFIGAIRVREPGVHSCTDDRERKGKKSRMASRSRSVLQWTLTERGQHLDFHTTAQPPSCGFEVSFSRERHRKKKEVQDNQIGRVSF